VKINRKRKGDAIMLAQRILALVACSAIFAAALPGMAHAAGAPTHAASLPDFATLAENASGAVVNINTTKIVKQRAFRGPNSGPSDPNDPFNDFFNRFFGPGQGPGEFRSRSLGSGFVIDASGLILTNNHVIEGADGISVKLLSGKSYKATVKGRDPKTDIALLKIEPDNGPLPVLLLGNSEEIRVGQWVAAIGNPFGLGHTVTQGIVSATGRIIGAGNYDDFIQTDAAINPGNSGGPLLDLAGRVIGINSAINPNGQGIGFAIPVNLAKDLLPQLRDKGKVVRGWLGVSVQEVTEELAGQFGMKEQKGALVSSVMGKSPAEEAGIKAGDIILTFDGKEIASMHVLPKTVAATLVGRTVSVELLRDGKRMTVKAKVGRLPDDEEEISETGEGDTAEELGLSVQEVTRDLAKELGLEDAAGVVVTKVGRGSVADDSGFARGDVITEIDRKEIKNVAAFKKALGKRAAGETVLFLVHRGKGALFLTLKKP
jgi:serine protease Do